MIDDSTLPTLPQGGGFDLLKGVTVLDLTTSIAGPYGAMLLGDMGAEVIKVERPGQGDDARQWGPPFVDGEAPMFLSVNRNKRSITLDYSGPDGRAVLDDLVRAADVVMLNQVPRVQAKLGTEYERLRKLRAGLVWVAITGYGLTGQRRTKLGYDLIAEGMSGVMDMTGEADNDPQKVGTPAADLLAGMDAAYGTLAALFDRARTGRGHCIDVSLAESMTRLMTPYLVSYMASGEVPRRSGGKGSVVAVYQTFHTADEPLTLGLPNDRIWQRFCRAVERPDLARNPDYATNAGRRADRARIVAAIQELLATRPRDHWLELFDRHDVPAGPIYRLDEVAADPGFHDRALVYRMTPDGRQPVPQVNTGLHLDGRANRPLRPPPRLGADTDAVLTEHLGYDRETLARLRAAGIID